MKKIDSIEAQHLLRELPYEKWLEIGRMMIPKGIHHARIASLTELEWSIRPTAKTLVLMRFDNLERWLHEAIGDHILADTVLAIRSRNIPYVEQSQAVYDAVSKRVAILRKVAEKEEVYHA